MSYQHRPITASFDEVIYKSAVALMKQALASRIDLYRDVTINGARVTVRVKITAEWFEEKLPFPMEL